MSSTATTPNTAPVAPDAHEQDVEAPKDTTTEQEATQGDQGGDQDQQDAEPGDREASKLRKRAQAAEADLHTAQAALDGLRRQVVEDASGLQVPAGLWAAEVDVNALFGEDGTLDRAALNTAVKDASDRLGLSRRLQNVVPKEGSNPKMGPTSGWSSALRQ